MNLNACVNAFGNLQDIFKTLNICDKIKTKSIARDIEFAMYEKVGFLFYNQVLTFQ